MNEVTEKFLTHLYNFTFLPIYYYKNNSLAFWLPANAIDYEPPLVYRNAFLAFSYLVSYQMTDFGGLYGYVKDTSGDGFYIIGPCSTVKYDNHTVFSMRREFDIAEADAKDFEQFLSSIPCKKDRDFIEQLAFLNVCANRVSETPHDLMSQDNSADQAKVIHSYVDQALRDKEAERVNNSLEIEDVLLRLIESGDEEGMTHFMQQSVNIESGQIGSTTLSNMKNTMIVTVALSCRAAIRGGLAGDIAFHLSDSYIQQIEASNSIEVINTICNNMLFDYTKRVAASAASLHGDSLLQKAIRYVQQNTHKPLRVEDVANHVGLSRSYLSTLFKKELGFDLSSFIRRCKLEEAKELLKYSDHSIAEISEYLCFSSQSHFQSSFKKQYKITPQQFRRGVE